MRKFIYQDLYLKVQNTSEDGKKVHTKICDTFRNKTMRFISTIQYHMHFRFERKFVDLYCLRCEFVGKIHCSLLDCANPFCHLTQIIGEKETRAYIFTKKRIFSERNSCFLPRACEDSLALFCSSAPSSIRGRRKKQLNLTSSPPPFTRLKFYLQALFSFNCSFLVSGWVLAQIRFLKIH